MAQVGAHRDIATRRAHGIGGEGEALQDRVGVLLHQRPVQLCAGIRLEAVGHHVALVGHFSSSGAPLRTGRVARPAPPAQSGIGDDAHDGLAIG